MIIIIIIIITKFNYSWSIYKCIICILIVRASNKNFVCYLHYILYLFSRIQWIIK